MSAVVRVSYKFYKHQTVYKKVKFNQASIISETERDFSKTSVSHFLKMQDPTVTQKKTREIKICSS